MGEIVGGLGGRPEVVRWLWILEILLMFVCVSIGTVRWKGQKRVRG
jgi:hypothetical protein